MELTKATPYPVPKTSFQQLKKESLARSLLIVCLAAAFYGYEFTLQSSPGVITQKLMADFQLRATGISILSAFFFYAYAPTQLVGGVLYDRFGPRLLIPVATGICALGALLFATGPNIALLALGRFCMGLGGALSFVGTLLLASRWLPGRYFPLLAGLLQALASVGAICGQVPLSAIIAIISWRWAFAALALIGFALMIAQRRYIRDWPEHVVQRLKSKDTRLKPQKVAISEALRTVFGKLQTYCNGIYAFCIWIPVVVFAVLWGIPFLHQSYQLSIPTASTIMMFFWIGIAVGSPLCGIWSALLGKRKPPLVASALIALIGGTLVVYVSMPLPILCIMLFFAGTGAAGQTLIFSVVKDINAPQMLGTAMGFNNLCTVLGGALCQPLSGVLLHAHWQHTMLAGKPLYSVADFKFALMIMPIASGVALLVSLFGLRETHCRGGR